MRLLGLLGCWSVAVIFGQGCDSDSGGSPSPSPEECSDACARIAAADCGDIGSECFDTCAHQGMSDHGNEGCSSEVAAYEVCFFGVGAYTCDAAGKTQPVGCDDERLSLLACVGGAGAGGAGAGGEASANGGDGGSSSDGGSGDGGGGDGGSGGG
jgi:hypothetical protein